MLQEQLRQHIAGWLAESLRVENPEKEYAYLPGEEKRAIRLILKATLSDLPAEW